MGKDEILELIPDSAKDLYGIEIGESRFTGNYFINFRGKNVVVFLDRILSIENNDGWLQVRIDRYVSIILNIYFDCFILTVV